MHPLRARPAPVALSLGAGLVLGLAGPVAGKSDSAVCVALSAVFSGGWPWAGYAFAVGWLRRSRIESALLASVGLAVAVVAYYVFKDVSPAIPDGAVAGASGGGVPAGVVAWGTAAFVLGAPIGLLGNLARMAGAGGLACRLVVPLVALFETSLRLHTEVAADPVVVLTWKVTRFAVGLVALALVGHAVRSRWRGRRARVRSDEVVRSCEPSPLPGRR